MGVLNRSNPLARCCRLAAEPDADCGRWRVPLAGGMAMIAQDLARKQLPPEAGAFPGGFWSPVLSGFQSPLVPHWAAVKSLTVAMTWSSPPWSIWASSSEQGSHLTRTFS